MRTIKDGGLAFPCDRITSGANSITSSTGMSLRDYFAAKAMLAYLPLSGNEYPSVVASVSYKMADAMLKARESNAS